MTRHGGDSISRGGLPYYTYTLAVPNGVLLPDDSALHATAEALAVAESGDTLALNLARMARAVVLFHQDGAARTEAFHLFATLRDEILNERFAWPNMRIIDTHLAAQKARTGDIDGAIALSRAIVDDVHTTGGSIFCMPATTVLVQALLARGADGDLEQAQAAVDRLSGASPTDPGMALIEITALRLKTQLAHAHGDEAGYRASRARYRMMATELGFEGHTVWAEAMP